MKQRIHRLHTPGHHGHAKIIPRSFHKKVVSIFRSIAALVWTCTLPDDHVQVPS